MIDMRALIIDNSIPVTESGCWIWLLGSTNAHGDIRSHGLRLHAHRASYEAFKGKIPDSLHVLHSCDTPSCVNPHHLSIGTNADNVRDRCVKGRKYAITNEQVRQIRERRACGEKLSTLSSEFGVQEAWISSICVGRSRKHASGTIVKSRKVDQRRIDAAVSDYIANGGGIRRIAAKHKLSFGVVQYHARAKRN